MHPEPEPPPAGPRYDRKKGFCALPPSGKTFVIGSAVAAIVTFFYSGYRRRKEESRENGRE